MHGYDGDFEFIFIDGHNFSFCGTYAEAQAEYNRLWMNGNPVKDVVVHEPRFAEARPRGVSPQTYVRKFRKGFHTTEV